MSSSQRAVILSKACALYLSDGLGGFSMRKLAKAVGVTAPALYRHFESKEQLLLAVVGEAHGMLAKFLFRGLSAPTAVERFERAGAEYLNFALAHPEMYEMMYVSPHHLGLDDYPEDIKAVSGATGQFWQDRIRELQEEGVLAGGDPRELSLTMWAHAHGLISIHLRGMCNSGDVDFPAQFAASGRRLMEGLAGPVWREVEGGIEPVTAPTASAH